MIPKLSCIMTPRFLAEIPLEENPVIVAMGRVMRLVSQRLK